MADEPAVAGGVVAGTVEIVVATTEVVGAVDGDEEEGEEATELGVELLDGTVVPLASLDSTCVFTSAAADPATSTPDRESTAATRVFMGTTSDSSG